MITNVEKVSISKKVVVVYFRRLRKSTENLSTKPLTRARFEIRTI